MKTFDLPAGSRLKVLKTTPHKELHGQTPVQAISLRLEWWPTDNVALNMLADGLQDVLFYVPPEAQGQETLDGIPPTKKWRRCPELAMPLKVPKREFSGYTLEIESGIDETTALALYSCTLSKFEAEAKEGGTSPIRWSLNSSRQITPELVGALCALEGAEIVVTALTPPDDSEAIDGTQAGFEADQQDDGRTAGDLFAAEHGGAVSEDTDEPEEADA